MNEQMPVSDAPAVAPIAEEAIPTAAPIPAKNTPQPNRVCIMVLGMHRSGTSALTRAISLMGAKLPNVPLGASPANETGHWEPLHLIDLHDRMLAENGSSWDDWRAFDPITLGQERLGFYRSEIMRIMNDEYGDAPLFVLKEPRISRFVPLYAGIMEEMGIETRYAHIKRNPLSVVASLKKRDGFSSAFSALLWLRHELDAERATRQGTRVFLSYEGLLNDWRTGMTRLGETLGLSPFVSAETIETLSAHFSTVHQHHASTIDALDADQKMPDCVKSAYNALNILERQGHGTAAIEMLDVIKNEFDKATAIFGSAFYNELSTRQNKAAGNQAATQCMVDEKADESIILA